MILPEEGPPPLPVPLASFEVRWGGDVVELAACPDCLCLHARERGGGLECRSRGRCVCPARKG